MSDAAAAGMAGGLFIGGLMTVFLALIAAWIVYIIAYWKVFTKMGEPGWKCIIPVYNEYVLFKRTWSGGMFWVFFAAMLVGAILLGMGCTFDDYGNVQAMTNPVMAGIGSILMLVGGVIQLIQYYYLSKSFGHGAGYFFGFVFLSFIFVLVIAFGSSRYIGPKGIAQNAYGDYAGM